MNTRRYNKTKIEEEHTSGSKVVRYLKRGANAKNFKADSAEAPQRLSLRVSRLKSITDHYCITLLSSALHIALYSTR